MKLLDQLCGEMIAYDKGDPRRIRQGKMRFGGNDGKIREELEPAEADMRVNRYESGRSEKENRTLYSRLYKMEAGKRIFRELYFESYGGGHA